MRSMALAAASAPALFLQHVGLMRPGLRRNGWRRVSGSLMVALAPFAAAGHASR